MAHARTRTITTRSVRPTGFGAYETGLYGLTLFAWGTSWYALGWNAAAGVEEAVSIFYRFVIGAAIMALIVLLGGRRVRFPAATHVRFAGMGATIFSFNFLCFYEASATIPSGILAVIFSTVSVMNMVTVAALARTWPRPRILFAAVLGIVGIAAIFWPELAGQTVDFDVVRAIGLCVLGNVLFVIGNMISADTQRRGIPVIEANAFGMVWGAALMGAFALAKGDPFVFEWSPVYVGSLLWLSAFSSVLAFAAYLTLLGRIGAGQAGFLTVLFPIVALAISTVLEGYRWGVPALVGLSLVLIGNAVVIDIVRRARL